MISLTPVYDLGVGEEEKGTPKLGDWQWRPKREYEVEFSGQGRGRAQGKASRIPALWLTGHVTAATSPKLPFPAQKTGLNQRDHAVTVNTRPTSTTQNGSHDNKEADDDVRR